MTYGLTLPPGDSEAYTKVLESPGEFAVLSCPDCTLDVLSQNLWGVEPDPASVFLELLR